MWEISQKLGCSVHKITYWMKKYNINKRTRSNAMYVKLNPHGDPYKIKLKLTKNEQTLFGLGLGIYWGEGNKVTPQAVRVTNTDPQLIKTFRSFLTNICQVLPQKIQYSIVCFHDSNPSDVIQYWSKQLEISTEKFGKIVQIPTQGKGTYKRKSQFGVCTITVGNVKLKSWIMHQLKVQSARIVQR